MKNAVFPAENLKTKHLNVLPFENVDFAVTYKELRNILVDEK